ncbi:MAG: glutaredoxin domain-containing protein [Candidatus Nanoarchaeia archaeon]|nr:thioredoxin family protein [Candidatus Jingweiarchaeum tengchongense]
MKEVKVYLFTSSNCLYCPIVEKMLEELNVNYIKIDVSSDLVSHDMIEKYHILSVPTVVIEGNGMTKTFIGYSANLKKKLSETLREIE